MLVRTTLLLVLWFCNVCLYLSRTNITVAIIYMFPTDESIEGSLLAAFYWGYMLSQVPGGYLAARFGAKRTLSVAVLVWSLSTVFTGFVGKSVPLLFCLRVAVGLAEGANYPSQMQFISSWIPFQERSSAWSFVTSGEAMGTILALICGPFVAHTFGWQSVFWVSGIASLIWLVLFVSLTASLPSTHPSITAQELTYIKENRPLSRTHTRSTAAPGPDSSSSFSSASASSSSSSSPPLLHPQRAHAATHTTPWWEILTNTRLHFVVATHCCYSFGYYVCLSWIQTFFSVCYHADYSTLGFLSVLPYVVLFCTLTVAGKAADRVESYFQWSATTIRKLFNSLGMFGAGFFFFLLSCHAPSHVAQAPSMFAANGTVPRAATAAENRDANYAAILLACAIGVGGFAGGAGYWNALGDLSVEFSSIVCAISSSVASIPGIIGGKMVGSILMSTGNNWSLVFLIAAVVEVLGAVLFLVGGSAEDQHFGRRRRAMDSDDHRCPLLGSEGVAADVAARGVRSRSSRSRSRTRSVVEVV